LSGGELLRTGSARFELGGTELFVAVERLSDRQLPSELEGCITVEARNARFGFRPVYFFGRQRNDAKVWSSAQFIQFM
jgi:hypothetical protein